MTEDSKGRTKADSEARGRRTGKDGFPMSEVSGLMDSYGAGRKLELLILESSGQQIADPKLHKPSAPLEFAKNNVRWGKTACDA